MSVTPLGKNIGNPGSSEIMKSFQLDILSIKQKSDINYGRQLAMYIDSTVWGNVSSYFWIRNGRWKINRDYANGRIPMSKFQDLFEFNGKQNYLNLNWQSVNITNRIISGLVGRWMNTYNEKIQVTATDTLSVKEKQENYNRMQFFMENKKMLEELQAESGIQMIPSDEEIPEDKEQLKLWQAQFNRIPEEILYELGSNDILAANGFFDVNKEKLLHDSSECGFVATYTWMDDDGVIHVEWVQPESTFYSYSRYNDFRDTTWRGRITTYKISEIRRKYGVEFGGKLTEEQLWELAQSAKEYQYYDNLTWMTQWNVSFLRPYDEWNVDVLEFELKTVDSEPYTVTTTKKNKSTILRKGKPEKLEENQEVIEDTKWNIYRGVYARINQVMLEWGLKKNMIRPEDPKEIGNAEFSYSFYMVQNYDMTTLAIPEKIQEPVDMMIATRLRMQQLIAKMRPPGSSVNWDAVQNIDYGLGDQNKSIDVKKLFDQTGDIYYRGRDAEGNPNPVPIQEVTNSGFLPQMQGLIALYDKHYQILKDELGEDPNLISQATQPRVAVSNIETAQLQAQYATDYFYDAYRRVIEDTSRKICCLLKNSVVFGSEAYRQITKEDVDNRIFNSRIQMMPTMIEVQRFEALLNNAMASTPELVLFINPFELVRIAKENVKLAESLFRNGQKKMLIHQQQVAAQNQQQTIEGQIAAAQSAEEAKRETKIQEGEVDIKKAQMTGEAQNRTSTLNGIFTLLAKQQETGASIPPEIIPLAKAVLENVALASVISTEEQRQSVIQQMNEAAAVQQQQQQQMQQPQMQEPSVEQNNIQPQQI